jgi:tripeptide aminopeptidase
MGARHLSVNGTAWIHELVQLRGVREALQFFTREKLWINEQHLELCRVPAPTFLEHERAQWIAAQLRSYGCRVEIDRAGNVLAWPWAPSCESMVALTAHLDTVFAPKTRDDVRVEPGGRFAGPGVSDNGAGLAALLGIARALAGPTDIEGRQADLLLVANVGEEGEGNLNGMRFLLARQSAIAARTAAMLVLDGAGTDHITSQALGSRRFEITISGPGGHSWSDFGTANPVHALARAIALFSDTPVESAPRASYNCGVIEGGASVNSIPQTARAKVDIRSESENAIEDLVRTLSAVVVRAVEVENERASLGKIGSKIREIGSRPAGKLAEGAPILSYLRAVDAHLGIRSYVDCSSTDANVPLSMGIPALSIGAGGQGGGAHTPQEWFQPEGRDLALRRILLTLCLLLREAPAARAGNGGQARI